ncbi:hypothetical protein UFOVP1290_243 [uncultured Caudovirales phage]|uniref:Uncharacterized protein n=1 Tax=uncultured Caudovirales phage TaxID=2100421 RepID=A0A6J5RH81_9CAUD|nr:hypothetical protein UFOVP1290_243 [uncultured Caudovirales phage]
MRAEKEILREINDLNEDLETYRNKISDLKKKLMHAETVLIGLKLNETKLNDELRYVRDHCILPNDQKIRNDATDEAFALRIESLINTIK